MIKPEEYIAYVMYLKEFHPDLKLEDEVTIKTYSDAKLMFESGLALGTVMKVIGQSGKMPLDLYSFLTLHRLDVKINDLLT